MVEVIFYLITVLVLAIVYKENMSLKEDKIKKEADFEKLNQKHSFLEKTNLEVEKSNISLRKEIEELNKLKNENIHLRLILQKISKAGVKIKTDGSPQSSSTTTPKTSVDNSFDKQLKDELELLKEEDNILKGQNDLLKKDNDLLQQNTTLLNKENENYKKQIEELREATKNTHKYVDNINKLNNKIHELVEENQKLTKQLEDKK